MLSWRVFALGVGVVLVIVGTFGLFADIRPEPSEGLRADSRAACGTAFSGVERRDHGPPSGYLVRAELECRDLVADRRAWAWPVETVGVVLVLAGVLVGKGGRGRIRLSDDAPPPGGLGLVR